MHHEPTLPCDYCDDPNVRRTTDPARAWIYDPTTTVQNRALARTLWHLHDGTPPGPDQWEHAIRTARRSAYYERACFTEAFNDLRNTVKADLARLASRIVRKAARIIRRTTR